MKKTYAVVLKNTQRPSLPFLVEPNYFDTKDKAKEAFKEAQMTSPEKYAKYALVGFQELEIQEFDYYFNNILQKGEVDTLGSSDVLVTIQSPYENTKERNSKIQNNRVFSPDAVRQQTYDEAMEDYKKQGLKEEITTDEVNALVAKQLFQSLKENE